MEKIAFLFAGQGAWQIGASEGLYKNEKIAQEIFDTGERIKPGLLSHIFGNNTEFLTNNEIAQPCIFLNDLAFGEVLRKYIGTPCMVAGLSVGELPALAFSHTLSIENAFLTTILRGEEMQKISENYDGTMIAVLRADFDEVKTICKEVGDFWAVNFNCPGQIVCAGSAKKEDEFLEKVKSHGKRGVKLGLKSAFHSKIMQPVGEKLQAFLEDKEINTPFPNVYANLTATKYPDSKKGIIETISKQAYSCVLFEKTLRNMAKDGITTFIEVGAGNTLSGFVRRTLPGYKSFAVNSLQSLRETVVNLQENKC